jgi:hypothetical protein
MISVLVYGRNDARGYGMHKRVAISLNTIAEVLSAPTSEILFVDYNTPNHLPTLPELIRDMLTEKARLRTRVLRARPSIHARFAAFSPLPVLEPIARNIALRRSRPQNPWILSTNTDAIIVPPPGHSLCDVVGRLEGTHYGTPRFELPERLWEALDRLDPVGTIERVSEWGVKARLNEVVRGQGVVQFDNPGDFQLVRRSTLFAIDGFDEEALLGWHVDHNLAHRLHLKHGAEGDLSGQIKLYHCGHARQPTATHSHNRVENDVVRFVHQVREPDILRQRDAWGCIDDHVGELDLRETTTLGLMDAIECTVAPLVARPLEAAYTSKAYDALWYDAGHVGVHLLDLLSTFPRDMTIGFVGCRRDLLDVLKIGVGALGFVRPIVLSEDVAARLDVGPDAAAEIWPAERVTAEADVLLFEFGLIRDAASDPRDPGVGARWTEDETRALENVTAAFMAAVQAERQNDLPNRPERMLVAINSVNSQFEQLVSSSLLATPSPFTTRLRYGTVLREAESSEFESASSGAALRALDLAIARAHFLTLMRDSYAQEPDRMVLASHANLIADLLEEGTLSVPHGFTRVEIERRLSIVRTPASEYAHFPQPVAGEIHDDLSLSRLARLRDFEAPAWRSAALRIAPGMARGKIRRDGWIWERAQLIRGLAEALHPTGRERALLVAEHRDDIVPALADMFRQLDLIDVRALVGRDPSVMLRPSEFSTGPHLYGSKLRQVQAGSLSGCDYDAIVLPHSAAFRFGLCGLGPLLSRLRPCLKTGGVFAIGGEVSLTGSRRCDRPDWRAAGREGFPDLLAKRAGLRLLAGNFTGVEPEEAALVGSSKDLEDNLPVLGVRRDGDVFWPACWFFEAAHGGSVATDLDAAFADLLLGNQIDAVTTTTRSVRDARVIQGLPDRGEGHVFFGPYLRLPEGDYRAAVVVEPDTSTGQMGEVKLVAEIALGPDILVQQGIELALGEWDRPVLFEMDFAVPEEWSIRGHPRACEIRLWSSGGAGCIVRNASLQRGGDRREAPPDIQREAL